MILILRRRPSFSSSSMTSFCLTMVVVNKALMAIISAFTSRAFADYFVGRCIHAQVKDSKPDAPNIVATNDFPISWISPSTVAITTLPSILRSAPRFFSSGSRNTNCHLHCFNRPLPVRAKTPPLSKCGTDSVDPTTKPFVMAS